MLYIIIFILLLSIFSIKYKQNQIEHFTNNTEFGIIVTTFNPGELYIKKCLESILNQNYKNYNVCILDDASNKNTNEIRNIIKKYCKLNNWVYIFRDINIGPLGGRIEAIEKLNPDDECVIVSIDGDDELNDSNVLNVLNKYYKNENILMTFGNYINQYNNTFSKPKINCRNNNFIKIILNNSFRNTPWLYSHLKTFKYKLYKRISHHDLKKDGKYLKSATDMALMYPMLEMSYGKFKCIDKVLYKYNKIHPESHNVNLNKNTKQRMNAKYVKNMVKYKHEYLNDNKFKIIITTYNPGIKYIQKCLYSIKNQKYKNYDVCVIDDNSNQSKDKVINFIKQFCDKNNWKYIFNTKNLGMIESFIHGVNKLDCNDNDILVSVDGDDSLFNENVLTILNNKYDYKTLVTFGNIVSTEDGQISYNENKCNHDWEYIAKYNQFRDNSWHYSHLKTFRYKIFKKIDLNDLKINNKYIKSSTDRALMYPILEMSGNNFKCIKEPLYKYNRDHLESHLTNTSKYDKQLTNSIYLQNKKKYDTILF